MHRLAPFATPAALFLSCFALAAIAEPIPLPTPQTTGGKPLMQALAERRTTRAFRDQALPPQMLSNLLWAAFGINRPNDPRLGAGRTAPSAMNKQEIELYVVMARGVYVYEPGSNRLIPVSEDDVRAGVGSDEAAHAAATIVYVAPANIDYAQVDVGFIGQNVYLFAASEGLNAWFYALHGAQDAAAVGRALHLPAGKRPLYAQSVGFPPK